MPEMVDVQQYRDVATALRGLPGVVAVDVMERDPRIQRPLVEVVVGPGYERVPPRVLRTIADHDLGVRRTVPQGTGGHFTVEVV